MKPKGEIMKEGRAKLAEAGLVPFSGYCLPDTKTKIKKLERRDRKKAGAPIVGN